MISIYTLFVAVTMFYCAVASTGMYLSRDLQFLPATINSWVMLIFYIFYQIGVIR